MLGKIEGRRRKGRQRMRWSDGITDSMDMGLVPVGDWVDMGLVAVGDGQGGLACCGGFMGSQRVDTTEWLNWTELSIPASISLLRLGIGFPHHSNAEIMFFLSSSSRSLILWDNRRARPTLLDSPQTTNTLDTESPLRNASRCSWPSSRAPSSEDVLTFHVSSAACQLQATVCSQSEWAWNLAPTLAPRIWSHLYFWSCLLWGSHGSIPVPGEIFESFPTVNHC